ncbi:MAG: metal-dependent hydrolase [Pirellulales bacterium]|nr:metal-dependent hydrolase [Pirellulales bacterium]
MKLVLLGTTGYHANDRRQTASLLLPELGVALDAGTGIYRASDYLQTDSLDIFLSHAHLDHSIGLTFMFDLRYRSRLSRVTAYAEAAKLAAIQQHLLAELLFPVPPPVELKPLPRKMTLADGSRLTHFPLKHPGGSLGFRIDWPGRSLAYVTDTTAHADADYVEKIAGVDLLVHEAYFHDHEGEQAELTGHSCLGAVVEVAAKAGVGRLVLVHINPLLDDDEGLDLGAARDVFADTIVGEDRMEIDF